MQRFQREAQTAARLQHPNIVPVFGVGQHQGYHYLVMQLIRGIGLDELLTCCREVVCLEEESKTTRTGGSAATQQRRLQDVEELAGREFVVQGETANWLREMEVVG